HDGDENIGPRIAGEFLASIHVDKHTITHVQHIIRYMSYKASLEGNVPFHSKELEIVQDADRLDAIGAIGIARAFHYGGFKNREIYNPNVPITRNQDKDSYKSTTAPTIHHFYDKLLLLRDKMNTATAHRLAAERHRVMEDFLQHFYDEWNGST
ncbi:MAG TPA: phosphohydrolase, partial [Sphingobacterium sp.]|nr:phosphohydrolase [Sphingobacterium sp.]